MAALIVFCTDNSALFIAKKLNKVVFVLKSGKQSFFINEANFVAAAIYDLSEAIEVPKEREFLGEARTQSGTNCRALGAHEVSLIGRTVLQQYELVRRSFLKFNYCTIFG